MKLIDVDIEMSEQMLSKDKSLLNVAEANQLSQQQVIWLSKVDVLPELVYFFDEGTLGMRDSNWPPVLHQASEISPEEYTDSQVIEEIESVTGIELTRAELLNLAFKQKGELRLYPTGCWATSSDSLEITLLYEKELVDFYLKDLGQDAH